MIRAALSCVLLLACGATPDAPRVYVLTETSAGVCPDTVSEDLWAACPSADGEHYQCDPPRGAAWDVTADTVHVSILGVCRGAYNRRAP